MLLFRCDASTSIGAGHFYRDLAIAECAAENGEGAVFVAVELLDAFAAAVSSIGGRVHRIAGPIGSDADLRHTVQLVQALNPRLLFLDGYHFSSAYARQLDDVVPTVVIDDLAAQRWDVSAVVNVNLFADRLAYDVPPRTLVLRGIEYALLRRDFRHPPAAVNNQHIFVAMGGGDEHDLTSRTLDALANLDVAIEVMVGAAYRHASTLDQRQSRQVRIHHNVAQPAALMRGAKLAVSAAGGTTWELAALGVPVLHIVTADNQRKVASASQRHGLSRLIGGVESATVENIRASVCDLLADDTRRGEMAAAGRRLVDARGPERVIDATSHLR